MTSKYVMELIAVLVAGCVSAAPLTIEIANDRRGHAVPATLWGGFLEEINYSMTGGLYPELIKNRCRTGSAIPPW